MAPRVGPVGIVILAWTRSSQEASFGGLLGAQKGAVAAGEKRAFV